MSNKSLSVSIVLPNWNGAHLLAKNLPSVLAAAPKAEIIVSDDASDDGSVALIKEKFPNILLLENTSQKGFAGNVNSGVTRATGDIVVLLNTDIRPEIGFLDPLLDHFGDPKVFAAGCMDRSVEGKEIVLRGRGVARWEKGFFIHSRGEIDKGTTAWVNGGSGAFRKDIWQKLGGMDALFNPFYWEDIDLSYRGLKSGYRLVFESKSVVVHDHATGAIQQRYSHFTINTIAYRNQFIFIWKNLSERSVIIDHIIWTPIRLVQAIFRFDFAFIWGYLKALFILPRIFSARMRACPLWCIPDRELSLQ